MTGKNPIQKLKWRVTIPAFLLLMIFGFIGGDVFFFYRPGPLPEPQAVLIEPGQSLKGVTGLLDSEGVIEVSPAFYWTSRVSGAAGKIRAGEYLIPAGASQAEVLKILRSGEVIQHKITFPEGLSSRQVVDLLNANLVLVGEVSEIPAEGSLLPETYLFPRGTSRDEIIAEMHADQEKLMADLYAEYGENAPLPTKNDILTLASIVEEETAVPEERPMIAGVFLNRLRENMQLQSDPTVIYGLTQGYPLGRPLRQSELNHVTPYNTYVYWGLPPTPISNPGRAAIEAVFNPAPTPALYFVADGTGGHVFSNSLEEHNRNVKKWRKIEEEKGGN